MIDDVEDELLALEIPETTEQETAQESEEPPAKKKKGPVSKLLGDLFEEQRQTPLHSDSVSKEMELYKTEKPLELDSDPLKWWSKQRSVYPLMSRLVQKVFSFVATSVPSEQLFSSAGETALHLNMPIN